jgi:hypothetical protein
MIRLVFFTESHNIKNGLVNILYVVYCMYVFFSTTNTPYPYSENQSGKKTGLILSHLFFRRASYLLLSNTQYLDRPWVLEERAWLNLLSAQIGPDEEGVTLLIVMAGRGSLLDVIQLFSAGSNPHQVNMWGETAFSVAARNGHHALVRWWAAVVGMEAVEEWRWREDDILVSDNVIKVMRQAMDNRERMLARCWCASGFCKDLLFCIIPFL